MIGWLYLIIDHEIATDSQPYRLVTNYVYFMCNYTLNLKQ